MLLSVFLNLVWKISPVDCHCSPASGLGALTVFSCLRFPAVSGPCRGELIQSSMLLRILALTHLPFNSCPKFYILVTKMFLSESHLASLKCLSFNPFF